MSATGRPERECRSAPHAGDPVSATGRPERECRRAQDAGRPGDLDPARRQLLGWAAAGMAGLALAPGVRLFTLAHGRAPEQPASGQVRWGMLVDATKCAPDCTACVVACAKENGLPDGRGPTAPQWIRKVELQDRRSGRTLAAPVMCQHCAHPPCVDVCPTGASFQRADGIVLVDRHTCIGCRYCMMACPYKARSFVHEPVRDPRPEVPRGRGCVESCTLCVHRLDRGGTPACVEACAAAGHQALLFGDLNDPTSALAQRVAREASAPLRADLQLAPAVRYQGL
ncbi:MAG: 4Fe-4S dicluster domain-containing protein [Betaproteobacteria bacterium]|nr:4Fe-4S dicluster domain-containing protein [Betaproteobacteria bacterium]